MAVDLRRASRLTSPNGVASHNGDQPIGGSHQVGGVHALTAAVQLMMTEPLTQSYARGGGQYEPWQDEAWSFYEGLGEFNYGVEWLAEALSRCRLNVAELTPGGDEPEVLTSGPATEIIEQLAGGTDGQSAMLKSFAVQLSVPGECYLVGHNINGMDYEPYADVLIDAEPDESGHVWTVQPLGTMRKSQRTIKSTIKGLLGDENERRRTWEIQVDDARWVPLTDESLICRVWDRSERLPWRAASPARGALAAMREIDMYNRYIMATLISRVALNGILLIPDEVTLPVNPLYEKSQDPFFAELLDVMRAVIKNPGSPASAAPLPLRVPADMIDKFKHLTFATQLDDQIYNAREGAIKRLAASINLPQEVLTGLGEVNHWGASQLEEGAIKIHISPKIEIVTRCLSIGYLYPMMRAVGEPLTGPKGGRIIVWYDTSQLSQRPDRSDLAIKLNDKLVISDAATRRETGFAEADAPNAKEETKMLERSLVLVGGQLAGPAFEKLTGEELAVPPPPGQIPVPGAPSPNSGPGSEGGVAKASTTAPGTGSSDKTKTDAAKTVPSKAPATQNAKAPEATGTPTRG